MKPDKRHRFNFPLFQAAIRFLGGPAAAASRVGYERQAVYQITGGRNGLSRQFAERLEEATNGRYRAADLLGLNTAAPDKAA